MLAHSAIKAHIGRAYVCPLTRGATELINYSRAACFRDHVFKREKRAYAAGVAENDLGVQVGIKLFLEWTPSDLSLFDCFPKKGSTKYLSSLGTWNIVGLFENSFFKNL